MEIRVYRGKTQDWQALVDFNLAMAQETENRVLSTEDVTAGVKRLLAEEQLGFYVIAEVKSGHSETSVIAGSLMVTAEWSDWNNGFYWWIQSVYVRPQFRRRGIYRRLYEFVKAEASDCGNVYGFRLYVEKENDGAQQTYRALGMDETYYLVYEEINPPKSTPNPQEEKQS